MRKKESVRNKENTQKNKHTKLYAFSSFENTSLAKDKIIHFFKAKFCIVVLYKSNITLIGDLQLNQSPIFLHSVQLQ